MKTQIAILAAICLSILTNLNAQTADRQIAETGLTVYNDGFAVVRQNRNITFKKGINKILFTDVAQFIDPTTVNFKSLSAPAGISILEQNYEYDLVNQTSLLERYLDKTITVNLRGGGADTGTSITGTLLAHSGNNLTIKDAQNTIKIINDESIEAIDLMEMPDDLVTKPTLVWLAQSEAQGTQLCRVTYTTAAIRWNADYSAVLNADETHLDFTGWVTIDNKSGATYKDAVIKLVAGDVRRIKKRPYPMYEVMALGGEAPGRKKQFEEKPFMEYHLYKLLRKSTINNNQVKQIEFIPPAVDVPVKKLYIYDRSKIKDKVQIKIEFENTRQNHLGIALPKGTVRVFKKDPADDNLEFAGEDAIDHTPQKEKLSLYIGNAFDIVPEYTLVESKPSRRMRTETHKIELRNRKDKDVTIFVDEKFPPRCSWNIDRSTHKYERKDARTARFEVIIKADSTQTVQYSATQKW